MAGTAGSAGTARWTGRGGRPLNVVWLMSDQHAARVLGCYGDPIVRTPHLDRLASQGMRFDRAYSAYPVCVPARFTMLTGRYPHHTGCTTNRTPLPLRERTAAHHFSQAGYATAFIGKMHPVDGQTHGFDYYMDFGHYYDYLGPRTEVFVRAMGANDSGSGSPWLTIYRDRRGQDRSPWLEEGDPRRSETLDIPQTLPEADHFESFVAREAIRFLRTYRDEPIFLVASFLKPHNPFAPPPEYAALYRPEDMPLPQWPPEHLRRVPPQARRRTAPDAGTPEGDAWARRFLAAYYGNVSHMDACAGRVLQALDELGLADDTLVLYTTDHGEMLYEHGLRGKFTFFEPSARIPLLARLPRAIPAGTSAAALVDQADFVPTLLEAAGIAAAPGARPLDGASFTPVLADPSAAGKPFAFGEFALGTPRPFYMRRDARWKYVYYAGGPESGITGAGASTATATAATSAVTAVATGGADSAGPWEELYDPQADPGELTNLAFDPAYAGVLAEQRAQLLAYLRDQGAPH